MLNTIHSWTRKHGGGAVGCKLVLLERRRQPRKKRQQGWRRSRTASACRKRTSSPSALQGWMQSSTCKLLTAQLQTLTRKTPQGRRKLGRQGWSTQRCGESLASWTHLRGSGSQITLSYVGQLERNLKNAWKKSAAPERVSARSKTAALLCTSCS